jgi:hypothetical protein
LPPTAPRRWKWKWRRIKPRYRWRIHRLRYYSNTLSNGNTINGTWGVPASNAQDAASCGHSGKAMGTINTLSKQTPASWLKIPADDLAIKKDRYRAEAQMRRRNVIMRSYPDCAGGKTAVEHIGDCHHGWVACLRYPPRRGSPEYDFAWMAERYEERRDRRRASANSACPARNAS